MHSDINKKRRIAVIPARGGSKRIYKKNIKPFLGEPIILRVLKEVSKSKLFTEIHVSTDDEEIVKIVEKSGYKVRFLRSSELSGDMTPLSDVIKEVIYSYKELGESFETIALIFSTAVFLKSKLINAAIDEFEDGNTDIQLMSIAKFPAPIERALRVGEDNSITPVNEELISHPSNNLGDAWYETGDFVIYNEKGVLTNNQKSIKRGFCLPQLISIDIDNMEDWEQAERVYKYIYM
jgi:pseudaminic acid cytidylyltransferase